MRFIDGHLDLAYLAQRGRDLTWPCANAAEGCISLPDLRAGGVGLAFGTIYLDIGEPDAPWGYASSDDIAGAERAGLAQLAIYETLERAGHIRIVRTKADLSSSSGEHVIRIVLLMEGADPIRSPEQARLWFDLGVRLVGLTWGKGSRYAGGNSKHGPLTPLGRELVAALDELGVVHDISHLSDPAVEELFEMSRGPVVATHSNCRALLGDEQRHVTDAFIRAIGVRGGVVGLNLYGRFLASGRRATLDDALNHVEHVASIMGHRAGTALGSDADGGFPPTDLPLGLEHPSCWICLGEGLSARGWSAGDIRGFERGNWERFLDRTLK